ncbi:MAG: GNAT family N-acetyltransferase [Terriglobia bacterium]
MSAEIIDIRHFEAKQFAPLLESECGAWLENLRWDYTPSARLISACLADKRLSGYALISGGRIRGYSFFLYEGDKGLIGDLFVEPGRDAPRHALSLLENVVETLQATPGIQRVEAQLPHFAIPDLEASFVSHGFEIHLRRFMAVELEGRSPRELPSAPTREFVIEPWQRKYDGEAARLLCRTYRSHIDAEINEQYRSVGGATHLIENIVHLRGCGEMLPEASLVAIHRPSRRLAGVVAVTGVRPGTGHIPQVAVDTEFQSRNAGTALMEASFLQAQGLGLHEVTLTVTDSNAGAVRFYERLGFETFHTFGAYVWRRNA